MAPRSPRPPPGAPAAPGCPARPPPATRLMSNNQLDSSFEDSPHLSHGNAVLIRRAPPPLSKNFSEIGNLITLTGSNGPENLKRPGNMWGRRGEDIFSPLRLFPYEFFLFLNCYYTTRNIFFSRVIIGLPTKHGLPENPDVTSI